MPRTLFRQRGPVRDGGRAGEHARGYPTGDDHRRIHRGSGEGKSLVHRYANIFFSPCNDRRRSEIAPAKAARAAVPLRPLFHSILSLPLQNRTPRRE